MRMAVIDDMITSGSFRLWVHITHLWKNPEILYLNKLFKKRLGNNVNWNVEVH